MVYPAQSQVEVRDSIACVGVCSAQFEGLLNVWVRHRLEVSSKSDISIRLRDGANLE